MWDFEPVLFGVGAHRLFQRSMLVLLTELFVLNI